MKIFYAPRNGLGGSEAVYALLESMYISEHGAPMPMIKKTANGKPYFPDRPDVHFSLSHSRTHVLCALTDRPVGADIETPRVFSERTIRYFCAPDELSHFSPLELWVLKESYIKLVGGHLGMVKTIRFSCDNGRIITPENTTLSKLYTLGECRAAVTVYNDSFATFIPADCAATSVSNGSSTPSAYNDSPASIASEIVLANISTSPSGAGRRPPTL